MQFANLIHRVRSTPYRLTGEYVLSSPPFESLPMHVYAEFLRGDDAIVLQGSWQRRSNEAPSTFILNIPFQTMSVNSAWATLELQKIGKLDGRIVSVGESFHLLANKRGDTDTLCSAQIRFLDSQSLVVSGMTTLGNHSVAFEVWDRRGSANAKTAEVISITNKRTT